MNLLYNKICIAIEYLQTNQEWIFSGIGNNIIKVIWLILSSIFGILVFRKFRSNNNEKSNSTQSQNNNQNITININESSTKAPLESKVTIKKGNKKALEKKIAAIPYPKLLSQEG